MLNIHVALIPDGNRRWARKRKLLPWIGHLEGAKAFEKILEKAFKMELKYLTLWAASWDNLTKRPKKEVNFLFKVFEENFKKALNDKKLEENEVQVNVLGEWRKILPKETQKIIEKLIDKTKNNQKFFLTFLIGYNGDKEMIDCINKIADLAYSSKTRIKVDENLISKNLWTGFLPPVDLIIRTGSEEDPHNSAGFMMWKTIYSQFYFTKTYFPAFSPREFEKAISNFLSRERRTGK